MNNLKRKWVDCGSPTATMLLYLYNYRGKEWGTKGKRGRRMWRGLNFKMGGRRIFPNPHFQKVLKISSKMIFISVWHLWTLWHIKYCIHLKKSFIPLQKEDKSPLSVSDFFLMLSFHIKAFYLVIFLSHDEVSKDIQENC